jgi:hypothetical protein
MGAPTHRHTLSVKSGNKMFSPLSNTQFRDQKPSETEEKQMQSNKIIHILLFTKEFKV